MPENTRTPRTQTSRYCPDCDGFPCVAITTGLRTTAGTRHTIKVVCRTCRGTGHTTRAADLIHIGK
ncbi:hypothetical protein [Streptomyces sp. WZ-12]|uniref:hypothetical protein n=1 Tax=Streptomyces sp. WZ-12 TaxID=3030210 RepID=UPI0023812051|nr:hypothetical protein [Streptomyces sp. WZ-12]